MNFDSQAEEYDEYAVVQKDLIQWGFPYIGGIGEHERVLELGAGTGLLSEKIAEGSQCQLDATDISSGMIARGKERVPEANWFIHDAWGLAPMMYDRIVSSSLLQWCDNPPKTLRDWKKSLNNRGKIEALLYTEGTLEELYSILGHDFSPLNWHDEKAWNRFFKDAGLRVKRMETSRRVYHHRGCVELLRLIHKTGALYVNKCCPGRLRGVVRQYDREFGDSEGVRSSWQFCYIEATSS